MCGEKWLLVMNHLYMSTVQKQSLTTRCLATPEDVLYPQITTSVYWTPVLRGVVIVDIGHLRGVLLVWLKVVPLNSVHVVSFFSSSKAKS